MLKKAVPNVKRWVSGYLVAVITLMLIFNNSFALSALAAETASGSNAQSTASASDAIKNSKVTLKNSPKDDVQILIFSDHSGYQPGETVCLDLYIKNNTDKTITDGLLRFKAKGIEEDSGYFEDLHEFYAEEETEAEIEETKETEIKEEAEEAPETAEQNREEDKEPEGSQADEGSQDAAEEAIAREEKKAEAEKEAGDLDEKADRENKDDVTDDEEADSEMEEEEEEEEDGQPDRLSEMEILPGKSYFVNFYYTVDPEIETMKDQKVDFSFTWTDEENNRKRTAKESFRYAIDALNLLTVTTGGEKGWVETGKEDEMLLEFDLGMMEEVLEEAEEEFLEKNPDAQATSSDAKRSSASNALIGWEAENDGKPKGKKDPAVIKNLKCEVETFGLKLDKFKVIPVDEDEKYGTTVACRFYVSRKTVPGTYYGKVNASYKIRGKSYHTSQGFCIVVKQETGDLELTAKIGDAEIIMTGPVEAFPQADELSLNVSEVTEEQQELVEEALQKKAEEEGAEVKQYKALDIKLIADGVETEPEGTVQVRFKNVNMQELEVEKEKTEAKPEEESAIEGIIKKAVSLFTVHKEAEVQAEVEEKTEEVTEKNTETSAEEKADEKEEEGKEEKIEEASESIKVLHLDEDEGIANEMKSEVQENGDIVMDTDHFSIYILVDLNELLGQIKLTVQHWANITSLDGVEGEDGLEDKGSYAELKKTNDFIQIYSDDTLTLENQLKRKVEELSKICIDNSQKTIKNYKLSEMWILKEGGNPASKNEADWNRYQLNADGSYSKLGTAPELSKDEPNSSDGTVILTENTTIRMVYTPLLHKESLKQSVIFYDYNITDGKNQTASGKVNTKDQGINSPENYSGGNESNRIAVGQTMVAVGHSYGEAKIGDYNLNCGNGANPATGMVKAGTENDPAVNDDGPVYNGIFDAGLFNETPKKGKKIYKDFQLSFNQLGDTYTLTKVYNGSNHAVLSNLETFEYITTSRWSKKRLFSNSFWPLDETDSYDGKDPMFGKKISDDSTYGYHKSESGNLGVSDDGKSHNWFFGMRYDFEFTLGDYTGPLKYYFRGDDDFWLFVDGVLRADIGGIHSSIGKTIDLNDLKSQDKNKTHHLTIIYAERGAAGSTCYMEFTLPNVKPVAFETDVLKKPIAVKKIWDDNNNPYRKPITVKLSYRKESSETWKEYGEYTLTSANATEENDNEWTMVLGDFPATGYEYKIEEVDLPEGYAVMYQNENGTWTSNAPNVGSSGTATIQNTLTPKVHVKVEKVWDDKDNQDGNRPDSVSMRLQYMKEGDSQYFNFPGDAGSLILDGEIDTGEAAEKSTRETGKWEGIFEDLPYYIDGKKVTYRVRELKKDEDGKWIVLPENNGKLPGKRSSSQEDWNYNVTYIDKDFPEEETKPVADEDVDGKVIMKTTVTNTFVPKTIDIYVMKNWVGVPSEISPSASIGLWTWEKESGEEENGNWKLVKHFVQMNDDKIVDSENCITWMEKEEDTASAEEQEFILTFNYIPQTNPYKGGWKNLPEYKNGEKIQYRVFEIRNTDTAKEAIILESGKTSNLIIDNYKFEVMEGMDAGNGKITNGDGSEKSPFVITNKSIPAELIIKKQIVDENGEVVDNPNNLFNEPINTNYKFMIQLIKGKDKDNKENIYTTVALGHNESSAKIYLTPSEEGEVFCVDEIVPMEYEVQGIKITKNGTAVPNGEIKVHAGDVVEILVKNTPNHENFFHHTASTTNKITHESQSPKFERGDDYHEKHGWDSNDGGGSQKQPEETVNFAAIVEDKESKWKEREWEEGMAIYG